MIVALVAPAIAILCFCCPEALADSPQLSIQARPCGCCEFQELSRDQGALGRFENLAVNLIQNFFSRIFPAGSTQVILESANQNLAPGVSGPPGFSSPTPLYLSLEVLRI